MARPKKKNSTRKRNAKSVSGGSRSGKRGASAKRTTPRSSISPLSLIGGEVLTILAISLGCFLFFSIISHRDFLGTAEQVGINWFASANEFLKTLAPYAGETTENLMGPVGEKVAGVFTWLFGFVSIFVPVLFFVSVSALWVSFVYGHRSGEGGAAASEKGMNGFTLFFISVGLVSVLSALTSLLGVAEGAELNQLSLEPPIGGVVGSSTVSFLTPLFGKTGALLLLGTAGAVVAYFLCRGLWRPVVNTVVALITLCSRSLVELSRGMLWLASWSALLLFRAAKKGLPYLWSGFLLASRSLWRIAKASMAGIAQFFQRRIVTEKSIEGDERAETRTRRARSKPAKVPEPVKEPIEFEESRIVVVDHTPIAGKAEPGRGVSQRGSALDRSKLRGEDESSEAPKEDPYLSFEYPATELLSPVEKNRSHKFGKEELLQRSKKIQEKLRDFNVTGQITHVHPGPVITMYEFEPAAGVKVGKITALQDDLAMALRAPSIRIIAPLPERGSVGIEVPNESQEIVLLRELLEIEDDQKPSRLPIPLGKDTFGAPVTGYIAEMPHLLLAGATGTGKSVCINAVLISLLYRLHPSELQLILIDPKILELSVYEGIPHLKVPVVTDPRKAKAVLQWAVQEMDERYKKLKQFGVRSIDAYNELAAGNVPPEVKWKEDGKQQTIISEEMEQLPKIMIVIDELADLMLTSGREVEELITRLAQKARAAGIHLLLATQRPSVDVITGLIKANFPARVSFRVSSRVDSRTILDSMGAERLLGKGDMLFLQPGAHRLQRVHGAFVSDQEVRKVTSFLREQCPPHYDAKVMEMCEKALEDSGSSLEPGEADTSDPLYDKAVQFVLEKGQASTSMIQRAFRIGYNRAARIVDTMEQEGLVGPMDGAKPRTVIVPHASNDE